MTKKELEEKYLNKNVVVEIFDKIIYQGKLQKGDTCYEGNIGWVGKGYHIGNRGFMASHIKSILKI